MQLTRMVLLVLPILGGCGGASIILKSPIEGQCNQAGLQGCPEMVQGTLTYIEGDKAKGKDEMLRGAGQNAPDNVRKFAKGIRELPLDKIPGAGKYTQVIIEIADILSSTKGAAANEPPPASAGPPQKIVVQGLNLEGAQLAGIPDIEFDTAQATIKPTPGNAATLGLLVLGSQHNTNITLLRVEGHTDSDGDPSSNQTLSERRAQAVVDWLVTHGVEGRRLHPVGCGSRDPIFPNDSSEHKARNRRTEFDIEAIDGLRPEGYTDACAPNSYRKR